MKFLVEKLLIN